jgi:hypothetical protein
MSILDGFVFLSEIPRAARLDRSKKTHKKQTTKQAYWVRQMRNIVSFDAPSRKFWRNTNTHEFGGCDLTGNDFTCTESMIIGNLFTCTESMIRVMFTPFPPLRVRPKKSHRRKIVFEFANAFIILGFARANPAVINTHNPGCTIGRATKN